MIGKAVAVRVKEYEEARFRVAVIKQPRALQLLHPVDAAGGIGYRGLRYARVMQTERREHGAPVVIGHSIPRAVACVALHGHAVVQNGVVRGALHIAKLALRHRHHIFRPVIAEILRQSALPDGRALHIGTGVGIADQAVGMFFYFTDKLFFIAGVCMNMAFDGRFRGFRTDQNALFLIAAFIVRMTFGFFQSAGQRFRLRITALIVRMVFALLQPTAEAGFLRVAFGAVRMGSPLFLPADKDASRLIARVCVLMRRFCFIVAADQNALVAVL